MFSTSIYKRSWFLSASLILCFYDSCFKSCQIILTSDSIQYWLFFSFRLWLSWSWVWHMISILSWTFYIKRLLLLLLLLSDFSRVPLCATPQTAAHQAPPSLGFSRQEHWSGLPFPSLAHESDQWKWSRSVVSDSSRPHGRQPSRLLPPWDFPGKSPGVGCHGLLRRDSYSISNLLF